MRREGRQHGMVRTYPILPSPLNPRPEPRYINKVNSPPTAGLFIKVSSKPSNHSKFTGKCGKSRCAGCHIHPADKAKDKSKGTQKLRSVAYNFSGFSASDILDHLASDYYMDHDVDDHGIYYDAADDVVYDDNNEEIQSELITADSNFSLQAVEINKLDDNDEESMSFCDVHQLVWVRIEEDEDWCVVESI